MKLSNSTTESPLSLHFRRFVENINLANDAQTGGMALYSRRADEAFAKVQ